MKIFLNPTNLGRILKAPFEFDGAFKELIYCWWNAMPAETPPMTIDAMKPRIQLI